ncbi:MAG: head GIN domain-containing protein [Acidimicrobiia bacterium]
MSAEALMKRCWTLVLMTFLLVGCTTGLVGIRGSGDLVSETRDVSGFTEIVLDTSGTVTVEVTGTESLVIEADDNIISVLTSVVEGGALVLSADGRFSTSSHIKYTVTVATLEGVSIGGSGDIGGSGIEGDALTADISGSGMISFTGVDVARVESSISGSGAIELSGRTGDLAVSIEGSGNFDGENLTADQATVDIGGSGSVVVNATDSLQVELAGSGNVEYLGEPVVSSDISGNGKVTAR